ncbi:UDP-glucuronosyltransferase 2B7-like [Diaphorina citri]|uniref:UDP-glucuronosyltransferase 2B7-like n=1 Tax=Diaphorina citri TaxID=121845 RepID=A0A1S3DKT2_DIACI|nr:UDP-glucuronosyltransferase 2B7-like [Diaphorina citri]XP_026687323.1 UDP-glucuronosyltransferase 2B7-like [Diaphorina citri]
MTANIAYMVGNPYNPGYMPDYKMPFTSNMNLWQRIQNTYVALYLTLYQNLIYFPAQDKLLRKHFAPLGAAQWSYIGDILRQRQALTLVDTSHVLTDSIAHAPNVMDVGGLHIKPAQPLPKDIEDFISSSGEAGVIYFAMGSTISTENLGPARIETLCKLFGSLEQRVLWKFDSPELEKSSKLPPNVKLSKWFPQNDILGECHELGGWTQLYSFQFPMK